MLVLVLFNLATASAVLCISVAFASTSVASLVGTLVMLFKYVVSAIPFPYLMTTRLMFRSTNPIVFAFVFALFQLALRRFTHQPGVARAGAVAQHHLVLPRRVRGPRCQRTTVPAIERKTGKYLKPLLLPRTLSPLLSFSFLCFFLRCFFPSP